MNERLLLGVTGSIAAYKAVVLLRRLEERGFRVPVVLTRAARRFVGRITFESLSSQGVYDDLWARREALSHISLLEDTKLVLVAPATADIMAKAAHGMADDLLSCLLLAAEPARVMFAPAMNAGMWSNPATRKNVRTLREHGARFVEPEWGELACGDKGEGRLADTDCIVLAAERAVRSHPALLRRRVVVTAGRTEEEIDPIRVLTNRSSGRMGTELAKAFFRAGADVTLVAGRLSVPVPGCIETTQVRSAAEMLAALRKLAPQTDVVVMAAAVADFAPAGRSTDKLKQDELNLKLARTPDVIASLQTPGAVRIGFSVETGGDWEKTAAGKLVSKRLDAVVANPAEVIGGERTRAVIIFADGGRREFPSATKEQLAGEVVKAAAELLERRKSGG